MTNPGPIWKCECSECNCEEAAIKDHPTVDAVCHYCLEGTHRAEREHRASIETRKRVALAEKELKERED